MTKTNSTHNCQTPVNVCFLIRQLNLGGAQRQLFELVKGLDKRRFSVTVVSFYDGGFFLNRLRALRGVNYVCLEKRGRWDSFSFFLRALKKFRGIRPDILYSFMGGANILSAFLRPFLGEAKIVWGLRCSNMDLTRYDFAARAISIVESLLSRRPDLIIANSWAGKNVAEKRGFPAGKTIVIPNGIDCDIFQPRREGGMAVRREWAVPENAIVLGFVGRPDPMKDPGNFLHAGAILHRRHKNLCLAMIGNSEDDSRTELVNLARSLGIDGICVWSGSREDMASVYSALDVLISSSAFGEGFPNVVGEAMACGTPCAATDVGDSARVLGEIGVSVPPKNPLALADAVDKILSGLKGETDIRERSRRRIVDKFSREKMVAKTTEILLNIL